MNRFIFMAVVCLNVLLIVSCEKKGEQESKPDRAQNRPSDAGAPSGNPSQKKSSSFWDHWISRLYAQEADLPSCESRNLGALAYLKGEKLFKVCNGSAWETVDIEGPQGPRGATGTGSSNIYDKNDQFVGGLVFADDSVAYVKVGEGILGVNLVDGYYQGLCSQRRCIPHIGAPYTLEGKYMKDRTSCGYASTDCSGNCIMPYKPVKNAIFATSGNNWVISNGSDTTHSNIEIFSVWRSDLSQCVVSAGNSRIYLFTTGYAVSDSFTPPADATLPPAAPLYIDVN